MSDIQEKIAKAREYFVLHNMKLEDIGTQLGVAGSLVRRWKHNAKVNGDNWDMARDAHIIAGQGNDEIAQKALRNALINIDSIMEEVQENPELTLEMKIKYIGICGDAAAKISAASSRIAPQISELAVALDVIKRLADYIRKHHRDQAEVFLASIEPFSKEILEAYSS